ncbi:cytochrome c oxidase accessory protein CcoG [Caenispirillum bisanense]|uniref:Cytochrome c oxidase accessory protein FixG n=1 Tax=Caenispirillum bisanense TaxID=414052 RepID=A0A286GS77_9PROT|nr:cytochrome c oxidase accessory protein CcoG [Caenispirillum bisanense]SOD97919.1 cytochrome c oxidase accessory protein FixG [Caenispirillum bisanense]
MSQTQTHGGGSLYASRVKIHPKAVKGPFRRAKDVLGVALMIVFFVSPWLRWTRTGTAPDQAILLDPVGQRGWFFGLEIWPQEVYYLAGILIVGVLALFMTASLAGRVWCGFSCPQTVFTDLFIRVERLFEGERAARIRLDKAPMSLNKAARRAGKHTVWLLIAAAFGATVTFYLADAPTTLVGYLTLDAPLWLAGIAATFMASTYLLAGFAREQFCNYMCPWPRIQSAMLDDNSLVVTYQDQRGDSRGPKRKSQTWEERFAAGFGDCIDCGQCVQACPIGIDIRQGVNADCINCGLCIDTCDGIMTTIGRPQRLIRFDSFANARARTEKRAEPTRLLRPRSFAYVAVLAVLGIGLAGAYAGRSTLDVTALKERSPLFVALSDGSIRNTYTLKVHNKDREARRLELAIADAPEGMSLSMLAADGTATEAFDAVDVAPDGVASLRLFVQAPRGAERPEEVTLVVRDADTGQTLREGLAFSWPGA